MLVDMKESGKYGTYSGIVGVVGNDTATRELLRDGVGTFSFRSDTAAGCMLATTALVTPIAGIPPTPTDPGLPPTSWQTVGKGRLP